MSIQTTLSQFDLLRLDSERLEDEFYNSNSTANLLKRSLETADLATLIECMEADDFVNEGNTIVNTLLNSFKENMSESFLDCIYYAVENGCIFGENTFTELDINKIENNDLIYYLLTKYDEVNTEKETIYSVFNTRGQWSSFKKYFQSLLIEGKINTQEERWKMFLQGLVDNCPKMTKSLTDAITKAL